MKIRPSESLKEISLLYVEDDEDIREVLAGMLKRYVGRLYVAENGEEGLEIFKKVHPDIVLSDVRMPKMDGIAMAEAIKKIAPDTAVIFTTAFGDSEYLQKAIDIGAQGYLIKPIERDKLIEKLNFIGDAIVNARRKESYLKLIHTLFNAQKDMVLLLDRRGRLHLCNDAFQRFCHAQGCDQSKEFESIMARFDRLAEIWNEKGDNRLEGLEAMEKLDGRIVEYNGAGERRFFRLHVERIDSFILMEFVEVTDIKLESESLERENVTDELTGVYNRKILDRVIEQMRHAKEVCLIMSDVDHFKQINDRFGHLVGDKVLKTLTRRIVSRIRHDDYMIRWGGEEFLIVMSTDEEHAMKIAEALRQIVAKHPIEPMGEVTMSFGVCCGAIESEKDFHDLIQKADEALYAAKKAGRNRVVSCRDLNEAFEKRC